MAENRKQKNQQKLPWWLTPVLLLVVLAIWFGGEALGRGFQWLSDSQTSESTTTAQKVPSDETLTVRFLDVGQGDSILLSCGEDTMLIDGGPVEEGQFLVSRLNRLNVTELTYVVNTHPDEDHCGGLAAVLAKYPAEHVYSSVTEYTTKVFSNVVKYTEEQGRRIEVPQTGTHWSLGSAAVTVIGPVQEYSDPNNGSLVLRVDYGGTSFLFAGVLALSDAIQKTGAGDVVADWMIKILGGPTNTYLIMAVFFLVPLVLTQVMSNLATLTIFIPLVTSACLKMGLDPRAAVVGVITASCISIMTPMAAPCQIMIIEPGGYKLKDYLKCGTPLAALLCMKYILELPMMFPLY